MDAQHEMWAFAGGLVAAAFAIVRLSMHFNRVFVDRLMRFMDENSRAQAAAIDRLSQSVEDLRNNLLEHSAALRRSGEWAQTFTHGGTKWE